MEQHQHHSRHHGGPVASVDSSFSRDTGGLPEAKCSETVVLRDGDVLELRALAVRKRIGDAAVRMLGYNGSIPGPILRVAQGAQVTVHFTNETDVDTTVHWHGLRLDHHFDGVPHDHGGMQPPIPVGGTFTYRLRFPDPGAYWYHPHIREDYAQEMGLYGNILVEPSDPAYWSPVNREIALTLDDILIEEGQVAPFSRTESNRTAMGRYGNVLLVNGETEYTLEASRGEVIRLYLTNTANVRVFNVGIPGARMKLVGGDGGRVEREEFVEEVLLAPSERVIVDVLFDNVGRFPLEHRTPDRRYTMGSVTVSDSPVERSFAAEFGTLRRSEELAAERERIETDLNRPPDKTLALVGEMGQMSGMDHGSGRHMDHGGHGGHHTEHGGHGGGRHMAHDAGHQMGHDKDRHGMTAESGGGEDGGIEWEDTMEMHNRMTTPANMRWKLVDRATGAANQEIDWSFQVGDRVKIRIENDPHSDHPMQHPFHIHGERFLVLSRDGVPNDNLVWKDTTLLRTGETVDLLLEASNPGIWMAHCHIAEHLESGMMLSFRVVGVGSEDA
jgi:FtsP/CotA-like multicopper oxidase with cupredoxin domain